MKHRGFAQLLDTKHFRNKSYLKNMIDKSGLSISNNLRLGNLK